MAGQEQLDTLFSKTFILIHIYKTQLNTKHFKLVWNSDGGNYLYFGSKILGFRVENSR